MKTRVVGRLGERCDRGDFLDGCPCARCYISSRVHDYLVTKPEVRRRFAYPEK
jgi:hypothetical protein